MSRPFAEFMSDTKNQHPAKELGNWLKAKRQAKGVIARIFAGRIWLSPAKYAEVEIGVVRWVGNQQEQIIPILLELSQKDAEEFKKLLKAAKEAVALKFEEIFSRADLQPVRAAHSQGKQMTRDDEKALLDVVFSPLPA